MTRLDVIVIGAGKRVIETALPAMQRMGDELRVQRVIARTARTLEVEGVRHSIEPLAVLTRDALARANLVYLAVGKDATPAVLAHLAALGPRDVDLLIDTPVVRFKHFRHAAKTRAFRRAFVAEDCIELPWIETLRALFASGAIGEPRRIEFDRSAYAYHGLATAKAIFGAERVRSARRKKLDGGRALREIRFEGGFEAMQTEPRDYSTGRLIVHGTQGLVADHARREAKALELAFVRERERVVAIRAGDVITKLSTSELDFAARIPRDASVIAATETMKRIGFLRLLRRLAESRGGYSIDDGLEDMVVDYHLEKLGRFSANLLSSPRSPLGRALLSMLSRLGS